MADEAKAAQVPAAEPEKPRGLKGVWEGDFFQHGLEKFDEAAKVGAKKTDEECPECEKERRAKEEAAAAGGKKEERKPIRIAKVQGKEIPLYTEEEVQEYINKGGDYTKKTQEVSDERKELRSMMQKFNEVTDRLNLGPDQGRAALNAAGRPAQEPEAEVPIEQEFGFDPEMVDPHVPKMAAALRETRKQLGLLQESNRLFLMDKIGQTIRGTVTEAVKTYPVEPITDDEGKDLTMPYFLNTFAAKLRDPANKNRPIPELAVESVRDLHISQQKMRAKTTSEVKSEAPSEDMSPEEFKAKFPKLSARLSDEALAAHAAKVSEVPPNPKGRGADVTAPKPERKNTEGMSMRDRLAMALDDPEISGAITPQ